MWFESVSVMDGALNSSAHTTVVKEVSPRKMWSPKSVMLAGILTMCFAVASLLFWNITYGRLRKYYRFLDNAETGDRRDIAVTFNGESDCVQRYGLTFKRFDVTDMNGGQLLVLVEHSVETPFVNGAKYLFTCAGDMLIAYKKL